MASLGGYDLKQVVRKFYCLSLWIGWLDRNLTQLFQQFWRGNFVTSWLFSKQQIYQIWAATSSNFLTVNQRNDGFFLAMILWTFITYVLLKDCTIVARSIDDSQHFKVFNTFNDVFHKEEKRYHFERNQDIKNFHGGITANYLQMMTQGNAALL